MLVLLSTGRCFATNAPNDESLVQRRYLSVESMALTLSAGWSEENSLTQQEQQKQEVTELNPA